LNIRVLNWMVWATLVSLSGGCGAPSIKKTTSLPPHSKPIVLDATREELLDKYNEIARGVKSVNATVDLKPTAGSKYSGVIEEYHEVKAFLLAQRPAQIRMIGQAPIVGTTIFDMTSDGDMFRVYIPSKTKFLVGSVALERNSNKPIENLRPQHLLEALLWPEVRKEEIVLFEEFNDETARYYVLTVLRGGYRTEILRKIWFDRSDLLVYRLQTFGPKGVLLSDVHVSDWQPLFGVQEHPVQEHPASSAPGVVSTFPRQIRIERPHDDYRLDLVIVKLALNEDLPHERFKLEQPAGTELIRVADAAEEKPPGEKRPGEKPQ
jgi:outer membrane lipoprotein-sorting protein